ncbi:MAG: hypothetical protein HIU88_06535 [Acidobacteria bacterium]|nr:hypothetical protein [Acidobacteriota bacterium]
MTRPRRRLPLVLLAASLMVAAPVLLSGCGIVQVPGSGGTGGGISIPGVGSVGTGTLPSDYPTSLVPVIPGKIVAAASVGSTTAHVWNITVEVKSLSDFDTISSQLTRAGFTANVAGSTSTDTTRTGLFTTADYKVIVAVTTGNNGSPFLANYTVTLSTKQ